MCCPPAVNICGALYSIRTSSRDDRCLVYSKNNLWICLYSDCKDVRAAYVSSDRAMEFTCQHIKQVPDSVRVLDMYNLTAAKIATYPCDAPTKSIIYNISIPLGHEAVYKVSDRTYVVYGPPSATNTLGFCHIKVENTKKVGTASHKCSCKGFVSKAKQEKLRALCVHLHVLFCSLELYTHGDSDPASASMPTTSLEAPSSSQQEPNNSHTASPETPSVSRLSTLNLYSTFKLPYHFSSEYLNNVSVRDASTLLGCTFMFLSYSRNHCNHCNQRSASTCMSLSYSCNHCNQRSACACMCLSYSRNHCNQRSVYTCMCLSYSRNHCNQRSACTCMCLSYSRNHCNQRSACTFMSPHDQ